MSGSLAASSRSAPRPSSSFITCGDDGGRASSLIKDVVVKHLAIAVVGCQLRPNYVSTPLQMTSVCAARRPPTCSSSLSDGAPTKLYSIIYGHIAAMPTINCPILLSVLLWSDARKLALLGRCQPNPAQKCGRHEGKIEIACLLFSLRDHANWQARAASCLSMNIVWKHNKRGVHFPWLACRQPYEYRSKFLTTRKQKAPSAVA